MFTYAFYALLRTTIKTGTVDSALTVTLPRDKPTYADLQKWQEFTKNNIESEGHEVVGTPIVTFFSALATEETD